MEEMRTKRDKEHTNIVNYFVTKHYPIYILFLNL